MANRFLTEPDIQRIAAGMCDASALHLTEGDMHAPYLLHYKSTSVSVTTSDLTLPDRLFLERVIVPLVARFEDSRPKCTCGAGTGQVHRETCAINRRIDILMPDGNTKTVVMPPPEQVRGETHGDYTLMADRIQQIKSAMHSGPRWDDLNSGQREALELIATKIGRIVCGDPNHRDHWQDIVGYATLVLDRIGHKKG